MTETAKYRVTSIIQAHPLLSFVLVTLVLSWWPWPWYAAGGLPLPIASFGPALAAFLVLGITGGRGAIRALVRSMLHWRVPGRWWLLMAGVPVLITTIAVGVNLLLGAHPPTGAQLAGISVLPIAFALALLVPGFGGAWEEPGWRGYALPRFVDRYGWKLAGLILGVVAAVWHLPLMLSGLISWWDLLLVVSSNVVITPLFLRGGRSVLLAMVLHATNNAFSGAFVGQLFTGADSSRQSAITAVIWAVTAAVLLTTRGLDRPQSGPLETGQKALSIRSTAAKSPSRRVT